MNHVGIHNSWLSCGHVVVENIIFAFLLRQITSELWQNDVYCSEFRGNKVRYVLISLICNVINLPDNIQNVFVDLLDCYICAMRLIVVYEMDCPCSVFCQLQYVPMRRRKPRIQIKMIVEKQS